MATCAACGSSIPPSGRFCSSCGASLVSDDLATLDYGSPTPQPTPRASSRSAAGISSSASVLLSEGRFLPGRLIAGRYRIVALLGRGGMGEVYRADDLTLGQPVALKFLPERAASDESLLDRFRNEVRIARRVSHPNVCRVYDVGEVEGHTFFTMEYVDGEDLASLLRRIGRLPSDKALEIARQLCAGLAAAHAKGVLHRDLKPANIMLDGRGQVVITDFGLAGLADQIAGADVRSGTPAYMSPEQLEGREVNVRSDIYALGLVLYEVFTGKRAFSAASLPELLRSPGDRTPSRPSTLIKDLDPAVERVILRCLEPDPANRPSSVMTVAAALPGGDPLAAALAAGETPSPQMVAAAGESTGLAPPYAVLCLALALISLALASYVNIRTSGVEKVHPELSPDVLNHKASEIIQSLGYPDRPLDRASSFDDDQDFISYVLKNDKPRPQWNNILSTRPPILYYWYRQSPQYMLGNEFHDIALVPDVISIDDPPPTTSGMVTVKLDVQGRLLYLLALPPQKQDPPAQPASPVDWSALFSAAGLDISQFQLVAPEWTSLASSDARLAWTSSWPGSHRPLRIEAAAWRGKPNYFELIGPWTKPTRMEEEQPTIGRKITNAIFLSIFFLILAGATWQARRNYIRDRGDRDGAIRLAGVVFSLEILLWLCRAHFVLVSDMALPFISAISASLFLSGLVLVMYLALEPYVRRHWPHGIISWSRLLMGQFRDPLVGRDTLFGVLLGMAWALIYQFRGLVEMRLGGPPAFYSESFFMGARSALGAVLLHVPVSIQSTLIFFSVLLVFRLVLRKDWLAAIAFVALGTLTKLAGTDFPGIEMAATAVIFSLAAIVVLRFGLVALATGFFTADMLLNVPLTADFSLWYATAGIVTVLSVAALAIWSFYTALGGRNPWPESPAASAPSETPLSS
jgi:serine/threonine-protein kinase